MSKYELFHGDCLKELDSLKEGIVDLVVCDLPFGTTNCAWDSVIDLDKLWDQYDRVCKGKTAIILFAQVPFNIVLGQSNLKQLRYEWIWEKTTATGHLNANRMPMKAHENIMVFYDNLPTYNPQKTTGHKPVNSYTKHQDDGEVYGKTQAGISGGGSTERFPRDVLTFPTDKQKISLHPTQKPVKLLEYLINTYSNEGDVVLDNTAGVFSTGIACINTNRRFIGIEKDKKYFDIGSKRMQEHEKERTKIECQNLKIESLIDMGD
jgi:site-specific DNA-methyltransferase (adenine-specific)